MPTKKARSSCGSSQQLRALFVGQANRPLCGPQNNVDLCSLLNSDFDRRVIMRLQNPSWSIVLVTCVLIQLLLRGQTAFAEVPIGRFVDVKPVAGLATSFDDHGPSLTSDETTMYFARIATRDHIWMATRASQVDAFGESVELGAPINLPDGSWSVDPSLSPDVQQLYFNSNRSGGVGSGDIWVSGREGDGWGEPVNLGPNINSNSLEHSPQLSPDGGTLYFTSDRNGNWDIYFAQRSGIGEQFNPSEILANINTSINEGNPSISSDGLTLFYDRADGDSPVGPVQQLYVATRPSTDEAFSNPMSVNDFSLGSEVNAFEAAEYTPYISRDWPAFGSKLYFGRVTLAESSTIYEATWIPEPSTAILSMLGVAWMLLTTHHRTRSRE